MTSASILIRVLVFMSLYQSLFYKSFSFFYNSLPEIFMSLSLSYYQNLALKLIWSRG